MDTREPWPDHHKKYIFQGEVHDLNYAQHLAINRHMVTVSSLLPAFGEVVCYWAVSFQIFQAESKPGSVVVPQADAEREERDEQE